LFLKSQPTLVLASTSIYRRALLERLGLRFESIAPALDETPRAGEAGLELVARLARAKAGGIAAARPDAWVIGSDQVAVLQVEGMQERILGKPGHIAACIEQLTAASGRTLLFLTAVALVRSRAAASLERIEFIDTTRVKFRALDRAAIERYVAHDAPLDLAGGFKSEALGIALCESIESGDPSALIGLPLIRLAAALRGAGFEIP